jgi:hypothetical protein
MKIGSIVAMVEYVKDGESLTKFSVKSGESLKDAISGYKQSIDKKWAEENKATVPEPKSPTLVALGKLQDSGLGQKLPDFPEATIVGKK